jgi:hypothetical protein
MIINKEEKISLNVDFKDEKTFSHLSLKKIN